MRPSAYASLAPCFVSGERSPVAEVRACLARLDAVAPKLNAFVHVARETALSGAEESERRWRSNAALSAIDGMAIGVKDIIETEDMPTGQGSPMWEGFHTRRDAACVQALREAGAIILGKTTTTEFAATEPLMPVRNPHDPARTAGGSSSGSAAAVGAGILPAALGTQVVGSTLRPASYRRLRGFQAHVRRAQPQRIVDHLSQSCLGILAATPEDAWSVASAIVARVGGDPGHPGLSGPARLRRRHYRAGWRCSRQPHGRRRALAHRQHSGRRAIASPSLAPRSGTAAAIQALPRWRMRSPMQLR